MENEEKKVGCCEGKDSMVCCHHGMSHCCSNWKKCCVIKWIVIIAVIIIVFCLGSQWGERKGEFRYGNRFERGGMMNWGWSNKYDDQVAPAQSATGTVTVDVTKPAAAPAVKQ